ncbi:hypothetical protein FBQ82_04140 [Anaerolineae bacterium CFX7]|nr:hypothetical protein [Anaerolineae bacterium CFX7]
MNFNSALNQLESSDLVRRLHEEELAYLFKHALVQDTAYASLLKNERKRLHRAIGETLEREYPHARVENAALLTKHFLEAGDDAKILEYATCAGDAEARVFAKAEAIEHYRAALDAALRLDAPRETIIELVTKLGRMYELRGDYQDALAVYERLSALAQSRDDARFELAALMLQATIRATPTPVFEPRLGQAICDRALARARELQDGAAEARALWNLLLLNGFTGRYQDAVVYGEQSLALARQLHLTEQIAYTLNDLGNYGYFATGQFAKARAALTEARGLWRELDKLDMLSDNLNNSSIFETMWGAFAPARAFSDEALAVSERVGSLWGQALAHTSRGVLDAEVGNYGAALAQLQTGYRIAQQTNSGILFIAATNLTLAYSMVGAFDLAFDVIQVADQEIEIPLYRAPAKAALAYITFLRGDLQGAQLLLENAHRGGAMDLVFSYLPSIIAEGEIRLACGDAAYAVNYLETLAKNLISFGIQNFVADADLYRGRALTALHRFDEARAAFERAYEYATRIRSQRALWQILLHWGNLERAQNNLERADELETQARALIASIAATLPENYRAGFLRMANRA